MSKSAPKAAAAIILALLTTVPVAAQSLPPADNIARMNLKQLNELAGVITATVGQDTLKLQPAARSRNCLELTRAANSFALGYGMLAEIDQALAGRPAKEALPVKSNVVQARVVTFAARVRAEEWIRRICAGYVPPAEHADDERYAPAARLQTADFTQALIEARQVAEANLAGAVAAGMAKDCAAATSALGSIQLLVPYLEKLGKDISRRPLALGPRASRRGLEVAKNQLVNAGNRLYREVGISCLRTQPGGGQGTAAPDAPAAPQENPPEKPQDTPPATPPAERAPPASR